MKLYIGIKDGKVWDITSELINKRGPDIPDEEYILKENIDIYINDSWDFDNSINIPDSPRRFAEPEKTTEQLKIEELEARILALEVK